jgi:hypothetical protein
VWKQALQGVAVSAPPFHLRGKQAPISIHSPSTRIPQKDGDLVGFLIGRERLKNSRNRHERDAGGLGLPLALRRPCSTSPLRVKFRGWPWTNTTAAPCHDAGVTPEVFVTSIQRKPPTMIGTKPSQVDRSAIDLLRVAFWPCDADLGAPRGRARDC